MLKVNDQLSVSISRIKGNVKCIRCWKYNCKEEQTPLILCSRCKEVLQLDSPISRAVE